MPAADHADGSGPVPASDGADYPSHSSGPPQRRAKRGKYVSRACEYCQRRKIKCAGGIPCSACSARRLKCSVETLISLPGRNIELIDRLAQVERQLDSLMGHNPAVTTATSSSSQSNGSPETTTSSVAEPSRPPHPQTAAAAARRRSTSPEALSKPAVPSFAGETSLAHTLSQVEHRLGAFGVSSLSDTTTTASTADAEAPSAKLPYAAAAADEDGGEHAKDGFVRAALLANGIAVERARWDASLDIFFDEVHILYPMLHVPDVIYLFRLDALERGEKVMSLAVSYAHQLGIHRQKVLERMPFFDDEMYRRVWWCVYILDRRYALESGRPFMTQDFNVDAPLPRNISDDWLSAHRKDTQTSLQMADQIRSHLQEDHSTSIPYLSAIANYSRIVGKVWEALYGARETEVVPGFFLNEYLETLLSKFESELPPEFLYSPNEQFETQFDSMPWWQIKQKMLIRMSIIGQFSQIPDDYPKFMFPFIHHLANATIISLALLIKEPLFRGTYGAATVLAAQTLRKYCTKTWVSGKLIRTVLRLNHMVTAVLGDDLAAIENSNFSLADMVMTDYDFEEMLQKAVNGTTPFRNDMNRESSSSNKEPSKDVFNTDWFNALFGGRLDSDQLALL
ncbi:putative transcription factor fungi protein [Neofusicoccum parvum UCRNP2]|uniref:Putative transcription factor fungi protein n=1 Tax=Botryosphaeria parva (strain UCR-NP2) TaxID=1287680 RepID=R1EDS8_BOTPV|nr:putative transcription factor fungi protein [Neofusicoccum parvum UCRNP2]